MRAEMGLPPIEPSDMARFMEAAFDDVAEAVRFVKARHVDYGVDPERIVLGGFSAGGRCACYATYGKRIGVAGVFSISGPLMPADATAYLARGHDLPLPPLTDDLGRTRSRLRLHLRTGGRATVSGGRATSGKGSGAGCHPFLLVRKSDTRWPHGV